MFTTADAKTHGWELAVAGQKGSAEKAEVVLQVESKTPLFALLVNVAEREGKGFVVGYGGAQEVTSELVMSCSGESYVEPAPPPTEPVLPDPDDSVLGALESLDPNVATLPEVIAAVKDALIKAGSTPA